MYISSNSEYTDINYSVPRPEVVKRVRPDKSSQSPRPEVDNSLKSEPMDVDRKLPTAPSSSASIEYRHRNGNTSTAVRKDLAIAHDTPRSQTSSPVHGKEPPKSPRSHRALDEKPTRGETAMAPPSVPSQTVSAQELRETAKQTIAHRPDKLEDRPSRSSIEPRSQNASANASPVPRRRSHSPPRPGTRNGSADSRASGGRARSDRGSGDSDRLDDKRSDRENRQELREHGRRESRSDRGGRERVSAREVDTDKESDRNRDRDRPRDRHGDREKERDRDREKDRRERDRERERDRDRDRDRDRHRRDDKDRDRDSRKERNPASRDIPANVTAATSDNRGLPSRLDTSRHRDGPNADDNLGKRRRPTDDEVRSSTNNSSEWHLTPLVQPDRSAKRSSRKDSHREERNRRPSEKDGHHNSRESDRRRADRNTSENEGRGSERVSIP